MSSGKISSYFFYIKEFGTMVKLPSRQFWDRVVGENCVNTVEGIL